MQFCNQIDNIITTFGFKADEERKTGNITPGHCGMTQCVLQWMRLVDAKKS